MEENTKKKFEELNKWAKEKTIWIKRIPPKTKTEFMKLADEEFECDYGFTLKHLLDFYKGIISHPNQELSARFDLLADEIVEIKKGLVENPEEEETLTAADGSKIRTGGKK